LVVVNGGEEFCFRLGVEGERVHAIRLRALANTSSPETP
jgi:hypothetical protein